MRCGKVVIMSRTQAVARICVTILGIHVLKTVLDHLAISSRYPPTGDVLNWTLYPVVMGVTGFVLLIYYDQHVSKIGGPDRVHEGIISSQSFAAMLRIVFFFCGLVILKNAMSTMVSAAGLIITSPRTITEIVLSKELPAFFPGRLNQWLGLLGELLRMLLGIYLVLGAPWIVCREIQFFQGAGGPEQNNG